MHPAMMLDPDGWPRPHVIDLMSEVWEMISAAQEKYGCGVTEVWMRAGQARVAEGRYVGRG